MKWYYNLKISAKLLTGFILVAIIAGIVGAVGIMNLINIDAEYTVLFNEYGKPLGNIGDASSYFQRTRGALRDLIIENDNDITKYISNIKTYDQNVDRNLDDFEKNINSQETTALFNSVKSDINKYRIEEEKIIRAATDKKANEALALLRGDAQTLVTSIDDGLNKLKDSKVANGNSRSDGLSITTNRTITIMITVVIIAVIVAIVLGVFISRIISKPIIAMVKASDKLALGDINVNVEVDTKDEVGSLAQSFGSMIANIRDQALAAERIAAGDLTIEVKVKSENDLLGKKLSEMVEKNNLVLTNIASASEQVSSGAKQVSASSIALSQGATEQASSIEELTASLEEISSQTKLNAENADHANGLANTAKNNAVQGNIQMKEMLKSMEEINDASASISKIIKVIDEIAFQTNILALNAAVEAARAGQHGKGFAVVAEEVRNLAARSANAAKETTDMIEGSIKKVEVGTKIARDTAEALSEIVDGVERVAGLVSEIAAASNEQSVGIGQISQGIMQVSEVVQTNSSTSEESAAASEELSSQAILLKEMVDKFKLKQNTKVYDSLEQLNPEILRMLEKMSEKKNIKPITAKDANEEASPAKLKISLSDNEFGKY